MRALQAFCLLDCPVGVLELCAHAHLVSVLLVEFFQFRPLCIWRKHGRGSQQGKHAEPSRAGFFSGLHVARDGQGYTTTLDPCKRKTMGSSCTPS